MLHNLWTYREFILSSIRNELIYRFARSKLRGFWVIIHPLAQVAIYALIFAGIMSGRLPGVEHKYGYTIYLMSGLLGWTLFSETVEACLNMFVKQADLMKKMNFPRIALPAVVVGSRLVSYLILLVLMLAVFLILGHAPTALILWLVPLTVLLMTFALGIGLLMGVGNVFVRDLSQGVPLLLQVWFWLTPIVYPASIVPDGFRVLLYLNPLHHIIEGYRAVLVYDQAPDPVSLLIVAVLSAIIFAASLFVFHRASEELVDVL